MANDYIVTEWKKEDEQGIVNLIRRNLELEKHENDEPVLTATLRRLQDLSGVYASEGNLLYVAKVGALGLPVACVGLGPLHGLPLSEGLGEIRDLVVEKSHRSKGLGSRLLSACIEQARQIGYQRLYLETSKSMVNARKLFVRSGFRAVRDMKSTTPSQEELPCYFVLEDLQKVVSSEAAKCS